jgi:general secretion pathway protein K
MTDVGQVTTASERVPEDRTIKEPSADAREGSALLAVLLILGMISMLAVVVARSVSGAVSEMAAARATTQAEADLRTGIELGVAAIQGFRNDVRSAEASLDLPGRRIAVRITNERGRIDLNVAEIGVLTGLLRTSDLSAGDPVLLAQSLRVWRSGFDSRNLDLTSMGLGGGGPQPGISLQANGLRRELPNKGVGTRLFLHPLQLASVPGFSTEFVASLLPFVTVASGSSQIDPFVAPDRVLLALPGTSQDRIQAFRDAPESSSRDAAIRLLGAPKASLTADAAAGWRLQITSTPKNGRPKRSEAVVALPKDDPEPYRVLYVVDDTELTSQSRMY